MQVIVLRVLQVKRAKRERKWLEIAYARLRFSLLIKKLVALAICQDMHFIQEG